MARASFSIRAPAILQSLQGCAPNGWVIGFRYGSDMYFFFSNRLGCLGSLLLFGGGRSAAFPVWHAALLNWTLRCTWSSYSSLSMTTPDNGFGPEKYAAVREHLIRAIRRSDHITALRTVHDEIVVFEVMTETLDALMVEQVPTSAGAGIPAGRDCGPGVGRDVALKEDAATKDMDQLFIDLARSTFPPALPADTHQLVYLRGRACISVLAGCVRSDI